MGLLYKLTFPNGKMYLGITSGTARRRRILHRHHAKKGRPGAIQAAIRKYGDCFSMNVLLIANDWQFLCEMEQRAIAVFRTKTPDGYNLTDGGEGAVGVKKSLETRARLSAAAKGRNIGNRFALGYQHTEEEKAKIAAAGIGRIFSQESRARIGATKVGNKWNVGRPCKEDTRAKISSAQKGRRFTPEHRLRLSLARRAAVIRNAARST